MFIDINKIKVGDRIRRDFGDIEELAQNIKENGLINPPTINKDYVLLAGERRLMACKMLGWSQIPVNMLDTKDTAQDLDVEMAENTMRRNFTGSELADGIRRQMAIESERARERMAEGGRDGNISIPSGTARDKAGEAFGISGKQAEKVLYVADNADMLDPADFADWDEGKLSTNKAYQRIRQAKEQAERSLADALAEVEALERQNDQLYEQANRPHEPQIIEREVYPEDYQRIKADYRRQTEDYQKLRDKWLKAQEELRKANAIIGETERVQDVRRDVQFLTAVIKQHIKAFGTHAFSLDHIADVDEPTRDDFLKSIAEDFAMLQNVVQTLIANHQMNLERLS